MLSHLKSLAETELQGYTHPAGHAEMLTQRHTQKLGKRQTYKNTHTLRQMRKKLRDEQTHHTGHAERDR